MKRWMCLLIVSAAMSAHQGSAAVPAPQFGKLADRAVFAQANFPGPTFDANSPAGNLAPSVPQPLDAAMDPRRFETDPIPMYGNVWSASPGLGLIKQYFPYPDPDNRAMPRVAMLDIQIPLDARLFVDGYEVPTCAGFYRYDSQFPLIPGVAYLHEIRVERISAQAIVSAREVDVYLRMGRRTVLTFY